VSARNPFQVGDRVVCIDDSAPITSNCAPRLELGVIYTIACTKYGVSARDGDWGPFVTLAEATFPNLNHGWSARRFELHERAPRP
jgi:hypothetical protein